MKLCTRCGQPGEFSRDKHARDGLNTRCTVCQKAHNAAQYEKHKEKVRAANAAWGQANLERHNASKTAWAARNAEKVAAKNAAYCQNNPERRAEACRSWQQNNPGKVLAATRKRQASLAQRTPSWADHDAIRAVYVQAAAQGMQVDHVFPLRGKRVSGLHVETNLQLLSSLDNMKKGNRYVPA